jgi:hypothetical protein
MLEMNKDIGYNISYFKRRRIVKVLVSLSDELYARMQAVIPSRQRSKVVAGLLEKEIRRREQELYECALAVEQDHQLQAEMADWDVTVGDGIETETW